MSDDSKLIDTARRFFDSWDRGWEEFVRSHFEVFADDCIWENSGLPTTRGPVEANEVIHLPAKAKGMNGIRVELLNIAEVDGRVWSERVDHILREDGSVLRSIPLVGVMEFDCDGRLTHWREYFDPTPLNT